MTISDAAVGRRVPAAPTNPDRGRTTLADPHECRVAIDRLLGAYGDAFDAARGLPWASVIRVEVRRSTPPGTVVAHERRLVLRPVVRNQLRRHLVASLARLAATLDERWLEADAGEAAHQRASLRALVHEHRRGFDRRGPIRRVLDHLPILPVTGALLVTWLVRPPASRPSAEELYAALVGILLVLQGHALLVVLARPFGAQAARALLHGGATDRGPGAYLERPSVAIDRTLHWPFAPHHHVVALEDHAHEVCGLGRPRRFPTDLACSSWHGALVGSLVFVALGIALDGTGRVYLGFGAAGLLWCLARLRSLVAVARRRSGVP